MISRTHCRSMLSSVIGYGLLLGIVGLASAAAPAAVPPRSKVDRPMDVAKPRVFVLTDIGNEPDDSESLVRLLLYTNELDVEGIVATTSTWQRNVVHPEMIEERVRAYGQVLPNLRRHASGYPEEQVLLERIRSGPPLYGMNGVGVGHDSPASEWLIAVVDRSDPRPVWITDWAGANVLAQALWKVRESRSPAQVAAFLAKLRVYAISDQDDAGPWIRRNFPTLMWVSSLHGFNQYYLATWTGISGEGQYHFESGASLEKVSHDWLAANIRQGPLGLQYPDWKYIMEGDTPSFLYLIPNGLGVAEHPEYGSWGGRYTRVDAEDGLYADAVDKVMVSDGRIYVSNQATVWRWRDAFQNDFAARIQWSLTSSYKRANHNPVLVVNGVGGHQPVEITTTAGAAITLDASGSHDPDQDRITFRWWQYREPSVPPFDLLRVPELQFQGQDTVRTTFVAPSVSQVTSFHVILEARDDGMPPLTSYRRVILEVR